MDGDQWCVACSAVWCAAVRDAQPFACQAAGGGGLSILQATIGRGASSGERLRKRGRHWKAKNRWSIVHLVLRACVSLRFAQLLSRSLPVLPENDCLSHRWRLAHTFRIPFFCCFCFYYKGNKIMCVMLKTLLSRVSSRSFVRRQEIYKDHRFVIRKNTFVVCLNIMLWANALSSSKAPFMCFL